MKAAMARLPAVHAVSDGASEQSHGHERDEFDGPEEPDEQCGARLNVQLVGERDKRRLSAQAGDERSELDQPEVAARPQRREVGIQPGNLHRRPG